jgi:hypothetical protein
MVEAIVDDQKRVLQKERPWTYGKQAQSIISIPAW